ncbi:PHP domain-containing protein [Caproicibacter sp. BJN0012]|uniref:PHP domain-containing protein n=1 Tax=Caproicibacter sp. BJN0012 TaxID=3110227 RepID=UPI002E156323
MKVVTMNLKGIQASSLDLHMHSNASTDGQYSPEELVQVVRRHGVKIMALSDHDTVRNVKETIQCAREIGLEVIPAGEFTCDWQEYELHVLGYGIDYSDPRFEELKCELEECEREVAKKRIVTIKNLGIVFDEAAVWKTAVNGVYAPERIAMLALAEPANRDHPLLQPFLPGGDRSDNPALNFAWDFCELGGPAYIPTRHNSISFVTGLIHDTGGVAVLAHPGCYFGENTGPMEALLGQSDFDGVEVYSSYHDLKSTAIFHELTERLQLLETVGSDFHGQTKPNLTPGCVSCEGREAELLEKLSKVMVSAV